MNASVTCIADRQSNSKMTRAAVINDSCVGYEVLDVAGLVFRDSSTVLKRDNGAASCRLSRRPST